MTRIAPDLDVRAVPPPRRHPQVFASFDALPAGEAFVLVNDHDPKPLLYTFQAERPGLFEWNVLEAGPELFRIEILRRTEPGPRTVTDYLEGDHRRLDAILGDVEERVEKGIFPEAGKRFSEFSTGLDRHIEMEERILFPAFEERTGMTGGPTAVMRHEHVEIRRLMQEGAAALAQQDAAGFLGAAGELRGIIGEHNMKEEQILYPMSDAAAGGDRERDDIVRRLQAL